MSSSPGAGQQENWSSITTTSKSSLSSKDFKLLSEDCNDGEIEPDVSSTSLTSIKAKDIMGDGHYGGGINNSNKISRSSSGSSDNVSNPSARLVSSSSNNSDTTSSMTMEASKSNVNNIGMTSRSTDTPKSSGANLTKLEKKKKMEKKKREKVARFLQPVKLQQHLLLKHQGVDPIRMLMMTVDMIKPMEEVPKKKKKKRVI